MRGITFICFLIFSGALVGCGSAVSVDEGGSSDSPANPTSANTVSPTIEPAEETSAAGTTAEPRSTARESTSEERFAERTEEIPLSRPTTAVAAGPDSLWMVDLGDYQCNDTGGAAACTGPQSVFLRAMSPESYEVTATASFEGLMDAAVAVGADAVWVAGVPRNPSSGGLFRMDPGTGDVSSRLPVDSPSAVDLGEDSVWVTSEARGALIRVDPGSGEKMADVNVSSGGASGVAAGESAVWVASWGPVSGPGGEDRYGGKKLIRVNPDTDEVTAEIPIEQNAPEGGASSVAVDEETGAVWATSVNGKLVRVDPGTNRIVAELDLGDYAWEVETFAGDAWVIYETGVNDPSTPATQRIARIDSGTKRPVGSIAVDGARDLAVGRDALWLTSSDIESGAGSLTRIEP